VPVLVNGVEISEHAIGAELQYHPAGSIEEARAAATRALVVRELLLQAAARHGIDRPGPPEPGQADERETDDEALIRTLLAREVRTPEPDEANCWRFYQQNLKRFRGLDLFEAAHMLFRADPADAEASTRARCQASAVLQEVLAAPERFADLARELSACPSGAQGGNSARSGGARRSRSSRPFCTISSRAGSARVPVKTRFGYHVLRLDRRVEGRQLPFEAVRERIAAYPREHVWRRAVSQYLQLLVGQAEIEGVELSGASTPLVQ
jgi:peptidyl-prolyl cis-trans isomerase C